ncbi:hypothetical protein GX50_05123 [[Emmonsia] crescens]|uniref:Uncharacterized protein n=1 Tax=[Emmonsia] crescens TaxID=73230 RepID=A0A2B7ZH20_9EURO|nr:hypothetical protein GX50_05123 [Emmonsia crescens]
MHWNATWRRSHTNWIPFRLQGHSMSKLLLVGKVEIATSRSCFPCSYIATGNSHSSLAGRSSGIGSSFSMIIQSYGITDIWCSLSVSFAKIVTPSSKKSSRGRSSLSKKETARSDVIRLVEAPRVFTKDLSLLELEPLFVRPEAKIPILSIGACVPRDHDLLVCSVSIQYFPGVVRDLLSVKNEFSVVVTAAAEFFYLLILQIL